VWLYGIFFRDMTKEPIVAMIAVVMIKNFNPFLIKIMNYLGFVLLM
jgi:hypothetical protein